MMLDVVALRPKVNMAAKDAVLATLTETMQRSTEEALAISTSREAALHLLSVDRAFRWNLMMLITAAPELLDGDSLVVGLTSTELTSLLMEAVGLTALAWAKHL